MPGKSSGKCLLFCYWMLLITCDLTLPKWIETFLLNNFLSTEGWGKETAAKCRYSALETYFRAKPANTYLHTWIFWKLYCSVQLSEFQALWTEFDSFNLQWSLPGEIPQHTNNTQITLHMWLCGLHIAFWPYLKISRLRDFHFPQFLCYHD